MVALSARSCLASCAGMITMHFRLKTQPLILRRREAPSRRMRPARGNALTAWFETPRCARLLTMRIGCPSLRSIAVSVVVPAEQRESRDRAPHYIECDPVPSGHDPGSFAVAKGRDDTQTSEWVSGFPLARE